MNEQQRCITLVLRKTGSIYPPLRMLVDVGTLDVKIHSGIVGINVKRVLLAYCC